MENETEADTAMLATELGYDSETVEKYRRIALLHDVGKIGVPEEVLNKPGKLTPDVVDAFLRLVEKGAFRAPDDQGGGSMENIENIRNG